ncbi:MAG: hypothetical protein ACREVE_08215 [Gammaproteobacteria bacterium]
MNLSIQALAGKAPTWASAYSLAVALRRMGIARVERRTRRLYRI